MVIRARAIAIIGGSIDSQPVSIIVNSIVCLLLRLCFLIVHNQEA